MKKNNIILKRLSQFLIIAILIFSFVVGGQLSLSAYNIYAEDIDIVSAYEQRNVLDDLEGSTIRDESFDLTKFPLNANGSTSLLSLVEFGYDFDFKYCDDYGLYIYVYNPQALKFFVNSDLNTISLRFGTDSSQHFKKYNLQFLNFSDKPGFYHLFYKFKVLIDKSELKQIHDKLNSSKRVYEVGEVELLSDESGLPKSSFGRTFEYSGYAQGYGPDKTAPSSLSISSFSGETLQLDVESTYYRPSGNNGSNKYTQDSLHSVYFAVPNKIIARYGEMVAVHATWYDAVLKPALVTGNKEVLSAFSNYLYKDIGNGIEEIGYAVAGAYDYFLSSSHGGNSVSSLNLGYSYNFLNFAPYVNEVIDEFGDAIPTLNLMFDCGSSENSAENFRLDSKFIVNEMYKATNRIQGEKFAGFSTALFESISEQYEKTIYKDDEYPLTSKVLNQSWWERLWGNDYEDLSDKYSHIKAIQEVKESDLSSSIDSIVSENLFIAESDVQHLRNYYNIWGSNHTIYLFRYQVSPYISQQATNFKLEVGGISDYELLDKNAYFFQMTTNLLFDIIDVTFNDGEKDTVIPVVMSPINIIHDATPPLEWDDNNNDNNSWKLILGLILLILLLVLLAPVLPVILQGAVAVIRLPFDLIRSISDLFKKNNRRR